MSATDGDDTAFVSRGPLPEPAGVPERAVFEQLPRGTRVPMRDGRPIRLVDLATHRSGLPRLPPGFLLHALRHRDDPYARLSTEDVLAALGKTRPRVAAGERFRYSNYGAVCWVSRSPTPPEPTTKPSFGSGSPLLWACGTP